mmetsp:Transcript_2314/g.4849  ORF Transcript_2314/g.4849 Transcript_2314/m.4849 type:complete len:99 (+) Transcript_2314:2486-2782(+)
MQPRSAKYFRSETLVLGPKESIIELGDVGVGEASDDCPGGDPGTLFMLTWLMSLSFASMSKAAVCWIIRIDEKLEFEEMALALLDTIGRPDAEACTFM